MQIVVGPEGGLVAYLKRPLGGRLMAVADRLGELGLVLPEVAAPAGSYVSAVATGERVHRRSAAVRRRQAGPHRRARCRRRGGGGGRPRRNRRAERARRGRRVLGGLDRVVRIVKVVGFVASAPGFTQQPAVINGASNLLVDVFGEHGRPRARPWASPPCRSGRRSRWSWSPSSADTTARAGRCHGAPGGRGRPPLPRPPAESWATRRRRHALVSLAWDLEMGTLGIVE